MRFYGTDRSVRGELLGSEAQPKPRMRESRSSSLEGELLSAKSLTGMSIDEEVLERTKRLMRETGARYRDAFKVVMSDADLARRYRKAHQPLVLFL